MRARSATWPDTPQRRRREGGTISTSRGRPWNAAYLGIGANLGNREDSILTALRELNALPTIEVTALSSLYETVPVGVTNQPEFLNAAAAIRTALTPEGLLDTVLALEKRRGRVRTLRWGPRVIDIDILAYDGERRETPALTLPHPRLAERVFALVPLAEIAPGLIPPGWEETVEKKLKSLGRAGNILSRRIVQVHDVGGPET